MSKHTAQELAELQKLPLEKKIQITQTRILEFCEKERPYLSYSGGKDSSVLLDIARKMTDAGIIEEIPLVYVDAYYILPGEREWVRRAGDVKVIKSAITPRKIIEKYGYPVISKQVSHDIYGARQAKTAKARENYILGYQGQKHTFRGLKNYEKLLDAPFKISDQCCFCLKKKAAEAFEKETGLRRMVATTCEESLLRRMVWLRSGCNSFGEKASSRPLSIWKEQDILAYIKRYNVPLWERYGQIVEKGGKLTCTGIKRTGCSFCLFGAHKADDDRLIYLAKEDPKMYEFCMQRLGFANVIDWLQSNLGLRYNLPKPIIKPTITQKEPEKASLPRWLLKLPTF